MKKIILAISVSAALISCDKNTIQQTTDSIKSADSLFTKANDGLKTLDSISKTINDSDGIAQKVILPEIKNQTKKIDSTIKSGGYKIDSINKELEKITKNVVIGTEVVKTLDSANDAINKGESPVKVLTKTADKILNQTKRQTPPKKVGQENEGYSKNENNTDFPPPTVAIIPLIKTAKVEFEVDDLTSAKSVLEDKMQNQNAEIVTQKLSQTEGFEREYYTVKVPLKNFDAFISNLNSDLGSLKMKDISSEGSDYIARQMCDVEITLVQKDALAQNSIKHGDENTDSFSAKFSAGIGKGFESLQHIFLGILPFWPFFLSCGIVLYFVAGNKKKKEISEKMENEQKQKTFNAEYIPADNENNKKEEIPNSQEPDYSKYQPKK